MTRARLGLLALVALLLLTAGTWLLSEGPGASGVVALLALLKAAVIGLVFLELARSWPGWTVISLTLIAVVCGGAALIVSG